MVCAMVRGGVKAVSIATPIKSAHHDRSTQASMPLAIYMGMRASGLEAVPRRHYGSEGLLGSSLAGQLQRQTRKRRDAPHLLTVVSKG